MLSSLQNFNLSPLSFWLGFFSGSLLWLLISKLRPLLPEIRDTLGGWTRSVRDELSQSTEVRFGNDTLRYAQRRHLSASMFALDEVLVQPLFLAPPPQPSTDGVGQMDDITDWVLPYLPEKPNLASVYKSPTLTLAESLQGGCHLVIMGHPGCGKTVALAALACQLFRHDPRLGVIGGRIPVLVDVADLNLPAWSNPEPLDPILEATALYASRMTAPHLNGFLRETFRQDRALLLLDGLDELSHQVFDQAVDFIKILLEAYPGTLVVTTGSFEYVGDLNHLGFVPLAIAAWNNDQRTSFIQQWNELWTRHVLSNRNSNEPPPDQLLISNWLVGDSLQQSPFELTLKTWAAFASDAIGASTKDTLETHLQRITQDFPAGQYALERLAFHMVMQEKPLVNRKDAEIWAASPEQDIASQIFNQEQPFFERIDAPKAINLALDNELLFAHKGDSLRFQNPIISGYLAGRALARYQELNEEALEQLLNQPEWCGKTTCLHYYLTHTTQAGWLEKRIQNQISPLNQDLLSAADWLPGAKEGSTWQPVVLRSLAYTVQQDTLPFGTRGRALAALAFSGSSGIAALFRQWLGSENNHLRVFATIGCGALKDEKAVPQITKLLYDTSPGIIRAACLALVAIETKSAMDAVVDAVTEGTDELRRVAAEALANNSETGWQALEDGARSENASVRLAVISGLKRSAQPWAISTLTKMQLEETQWMLKDAVTQALEALSQTNPRIPKKMPSILEAPWLIEFASQLGIGIASERTALELVYRAVNEGDEIQRLYAIQYLGFYGDENAILNLLPSLGSNNIDIREAALQACWQLVRSGKPLPQYALA